MFCITIDPLIIFFRKNYFPIFSPRILLGMLLLKQYLVPNSFFSCLLIFKWIISFYFCLSNKNNLRYQYIPSQGNFEGFQIFRNKKLNLSWRCSKKIPQIFCDSSFPAPSFRCVFQLTEIIFLLMLILSSYKKLYFISVLNVPFLYSLANQSVVQGPAASALPGSLLEVQLSDPWITNSTSNRLSMSFKCTLKFVNQCYTTHFWFSLQISKAMPYIATMSWDWWWLFAGHTCS